MIKFMTGIIVGVFVGAMIIEVLERTRPQILHTVQDKARDAARRVASFTAGKPAGDRVV